MGNSKKGATAPQSSKSVTDKVMQTVQQAEASARRTVAASKLGFENRSSKATFLRIVGVKSPKNGNRDGVNLIVAEGPKLTSNKKSTSHFITFDELLLEHVTQQCLSRKESMDDIDEGRLEPMVSIVHEHLDTGAIEKEYYWYNVTLFSVAQDSQPHESADAVDVVDDEGNVLESGKYIRRKVGYIND